jgi:hypothetical protein
MEVAMTRYDSRDAAPPLDVHAPDASNHDNRALDVGRSGADQRRLDLRAAVRARTVRATLAAAPLHRARLLRAMMAGRRAA